MEKRKLTLSLVSSQAALLRAAAPGQRAVGQRIGDLAEALRRDWISAAWKLEHEQQWSRKQIEHAARASALDGLVPFDLSLLEKAFILGAADAPDPEEYRTRIRTLPPEYICLVWQIGRELKLGNSEVERYLTEVY